MYKGFASPNDQKFNYEISIESRVSRDSKHLGAIAEKRYDNELTKQLCPRGGGANYLDLNGSSSNR